MSQNQYPIIKADFKADPASSLANFAIEGSGKSLGLEYDNGDIYVRLKDGTNVSYPYFAIDNATPDSWYTAEFDLSPTEVKVYVYPQGGTKSQAFTFNISNWSPGLRFYNRNGNNSIDNVSVQARKEVNDYLYDNLNRLTKVTDINNSTVEYEYDNLGNRMKKKTDGNTQYTYTYSPANELDLVKNPDNSTAIDFDYDANGNTTKKTQGTEVTDYSYDQNNNLVKVEKPNNDVIEFIYDANGRRVEKKVNNVSTYYQYDSIGNLVLETDNSRNIKVKYIRDTGAQALAQEQNGQIYYYLYNAHGDVTSVTDSSGNVVASYSYDEFGNLSSSTGLIYNPLRYSGANNAYYDEEIGLYKMGVRYYNPEVGRLITRDMFEGFREEPQSKNRYAYVENDPINGFDPDGTHKEDLYTSTTEISGNSRKNVIRRANVAKKSVYHLINKHGKSGLSSGLVFMMILQEGSHNIDNTLKGDGIMQVTSASGYRSGDYNNSPKSIYKNVQDGMSYLYSLMTGYPVNGHGCAPEYENVRAAWHYNGGPNDPYDVYNGKDNIWDNKDDRGDKNYLGNLRKHNKHIKDNFKYKGKYYLATHYYPKIRDELGRAQGLVNNGIWNRRDRKPGQKKKQEY